MMVEDLPQIMELENKLQHRPWKQYGFGQAIRLDHRCMVIERDGIIVGYGVADKGHGRTILAQEPRAAAILYNDWQENASACGAPLMWAEVSPENVSAIGNLIHFGFTRQGVRPSFYGPGQDAHVYTRVVTQNIKAVQGFRPVENIA